MTFQKFIIPWFFLALVLNGCTSTPKKTSPVAQNTTVKEPPLEEILVIAESKASDNGRKVLETGRQMALIDGEIIQGGCWDYANAVFNRAGFAKNRNIVFKGSKTKGIFADVGLIQPGDFLYYVNHSYGDGEHSAIFVDWLDYEGKIALMLSYAGEQRQTPARYASYDLSNVYNIIRAQ